MTQQALFDVRVQGRFDFSGNLLFDGLDFKLPAGQWTCLVGVSGVGKSTLLRLIAGLETGGSFSGSVETSDSLPVTGRVAYMAQSDLLLPWLTVTDNIALGQRLRKQSVDHQSVAAIVDRIGLAADAGKKPPALSGGMRQRVALARTLMEDTPLVLLDEPFSALDARTRSEMQALAFEVLKDRTVLMVTHDPAEAIRLGHQVFEIATGGLRAHPVPQSLPLRAVDDTESLALQARLLLSLQGTGDQTNAERIV